MTDAQAQAAAEQDAELREALTDIFNARGRVLGWFTADGQLRPEAREAAFEFTIGVHAGLRAAGLRGFHGLELMAASVRGADFIFAISKES